MGWPCGITCRNCGKTYISPGSDHVEWCRSCLEKRKEKQKQDAEDLSRLRKQEVGVKKSIKDLEVQVEKLKVDQAKPAIQNTSPRIVENAQSEDRDLCQICLAAPLTQAIVPCGHFICCEGECKVGLKTCPICRGEITRFLRIYQVV